MDFKIILLSALIPLIVGFVWYHPKVFGNAWMKATGLTPESAKGANMGLVFFLTYVLSVLFALAIMGMTIHQIHFYSIMADQPNVNDPNSPAGQELANLLKLYGDRYRTFGHGAFHGFLGGLFFALPIIGINALFERRSFKYVAINVGYWCLAMLLMGGVICACTKAY
jgi:hypothetical protein